LSIHAAAYYLKIYFEKLEKEKEKENQLHSVFGPPASPRPASARGPVSFFPLPRPAPFLG
jgi:hypothetical protein